MHPFRPRTRRPLTSVRAAVLAAVLSLTGLAAALTTTSAQAAAPAPTGAVTTRSVAASSSSSVPEVSSLRVTGARVDVTIRKVYRTGQVHWINHVLDTRLTNLDGCQAERIGPSWRNHVYRASIDLVCADGPGHVRSAVRALVTSRPWYRTAVTDVPLTGFSLTAPDGLDGTPGLGDGSGAALEVLPSGEFSFPDGDQTGLSYVGRGVTQAQLQAAVAAFAKALKITPGQVRVGPLF